jgi:bifunctional DNA-binding transcriptional regulator/antitoxin component of YhaV-PrlF toxin-antitoxin module
MCTQRTVPTAIELIELVSDKVCQLVASKTSFTVFEITHGLRAINTQTEISHDDVKFAVNQMLKAGQMCDYIKTSRPLKVGGSAFVYHDINDNPDNHTAVDNGSSVATTTDAADADADADDDANDEEDIVEITKESRLNIPQNLLKKLGMNVGDTVYLLFDNRTDSMILTKIDRHGSRDFKVNADGAVRISQCRLIEKLGASQFYKVGVENIDIDGITESVISIKSAK